MVCRRVPPDIELDHMKHECPHCYRPLNRALLKQKHVSLMRAQLVCPFCGGVVQVKRYGEELFGKVLAIIPLVTVAKAIASDSPVSSWYLAVGAVALLITIVAFVGYRLRYRQRYVKSESGNN